MRVLFTTWGWPSHFYPLVQLAWATRAAGHEVVVASQPQLATTITDAGLTAARVGSNFDVRPHLEPLYTRMARRGRPVEMAELLNRFGAATVSMYVDIAADMLDESVALAEAWRPDLVVFDPTTFSGPLIAAKLGVPAVRHIWGMDFTYLSHEYEPDAVQPLADRLGLGRVDTLGAVTVDPCPPSLQVPNPVRRLVMRYAPYNGVAEVPDWLRHPPEVPRICVTGSTVSGRFAGEQESLDSRVVEALAGVDVEIVVVNPGEHGSLRRSAPANVRVVPQLAMHLLLPSCALAIHAGGGGMVLTSIATSTPQLLVPSNPDHIFNARRLQELGAGWMLFSNHATNDMIRAYATDALHKEGLRVNTAKLRQEMAEQPSAAQVVASLAELAETGNLSEAGSLSEACDVAA